MKYDRKNTICIKYYTWEPRKLYNQTVLNLEMCLKQYLGNGNFWNTHDTELIAGLSDQQRWLFCWTDAVFGVLGHRSTRLFRRLSPYSEWSLSSVPWNLVSFPPKHFQFIHEGKIWPGVCCEGKGWFNMFWLSTVVLYLTYCGLVIPYNDIDLDQHWLR